jgi:membrane associated rhomboid family serine protease
MFIVLPVGMNYQTQRLPVVTFSLIGVNTLIWLATTCAEIGTKGDSDFWVMSNLWLIPSQSALLTYLTSMFVHAGFFHLLGNMIFLFLFGCCVEDILGRVRFLIFYLMGGLIAELAYIAFSPMHFASHIPMGGASGAISACMGMYLLLRAGADIEFKYFYWLLFAYVGAGEFTLPAWVAISLWFAKDLFWMVLGMLFNHQGGGVAFGAHVGGMLGGLGLVAIYRWIGKRFERPEAETEEIDEPTQISPAAEPIRVFRPAPAATSETPTIFLHDGHQQAGPFTLSQIHAKLHTGEIGPEVKYWCEGLDGWQSVAELSDSPSG